MPKGTVAPGKVLPPAPPGTGKGESLSSVPMNGSTYFARLALAGGGPASGSPVPPSVSVPVPEPGAGTPESGSGSDTPESGVPVPGVPGPGSSSRQPGAASVRRKSEPHRTARCRVFDMKFSIGANLGRGDRDTGNSCLRKSCQDKQSYGVLTTRARALLEEFSLRATRGPGGRSGEGGDETAAGATRGGAGRRTRPRVRGVTTASRRARASMDTTSRVAD